MTSKPVTVRKRRRLRFASFDDVVADAQRAHAGRYEPLGNWSLGQAVKHLGTAMDASIDGVDFPAPLYLRVLGRLILRPVILYWQFPPGAKLPPSAAKVLVAKDTTPFDEALRVLRAGMERLARESGRKSHPVIGRLSVAQWNRFHLRHAELHLSFFVPPAPQ